MTRPSSWLWSKDVAKEDFLPHRLYFPTPALGMEGGCLGVLVVGVRILK